MAANKDEVTKKARWWWDEAAESVQATGRARELASELGIKDPSRYSDNRVKQAIVHAREDIVMVVAYLSAVNFQLNRITYALYVAVIILLYIAFRLS
jgi:hypothetical protein